MKVLVLTGIIFSSIMFFISLICFCKAIFSETMKYSKRKKLLEEAVAVLLNGIFYWIIIGVLYGGCLLAAAIMK